MELFVERQCQQQAIDKRIMCKAPKSFQACTVDT